jgi:hypothetical protein
MRENNKKKIGVLTFHYSKYNFGAVLQAYSARKNIEDLGYDAYLINYKPINKSIKAFVWNLIMSVFGFRFSRFRKKEIPNILDETNTFSELTKLNDKLDGFVVGSDQVWRYIEDTEALSTYYLHFVNENKVKIAYAASFGVDYWPDNRPLETEEIKKLAQNFSSISVREESGIKLCKDYFNVDSTRVLDPTMLVERSVFHEMASHEKSSKEKVFAYMMLHNSKKNEKYFRGLAKKEKAKFRRLQGIKFYSPKMIYFYRSINDWLSYIRDAEIIITDSFHTVVFATVFRKNFVVISNPTNGITRLKNLLKMIGEEKKFYDSVEDINLKELFKQPNYDFIYEKIEEERKHSLKFLKESLSKVS